MSNEHKPLYTAEQIQKWSKAQLWAAYELDRDNTRMARAKDRELMQMLVDALFTVHDGCTNHLDVQDALKLAAERGTTPTDQ